MPSPPAHSHAPHTHDPHTHTPHTHHPHSPHSHSPSGSSCHCKLKCYPEGGDCNSDGSCECYRRRLGEDKPHLQLASERTTITPSPLAPPSTPSPSLLSKEGAPRLPATSTVPAASRGASDASSRRLTLATSSSSQPARRLPPPPPPSPPFAARHGRQLAVDQCRNQCGDCTSLCHAHHPHTHHPHQCVACIESI